MPATLHVLTLPYFVALGNSVRLRRVQRSVTKMQRQDPDSGIQLRVTSES